ncbi:long-chain acyl-CoA synthetase [Scopulibacillus daqui]|uniref:Long-chain acyl-CoA synthetase n=1 Tax=Scopulibacillus daqui TaxID=1469162 RepID=A0ABS2PZW3_9BACL|nr:long-chain acyl-CoA synthetase [Scopulibacillus daqui]
MITEKFFYYAKRYPYKRALVTSHHTVTYKQLGEQIHNVCSFFLHKMDICQLRVGLFLPNSIEYIAYFLGAVHSGNICAPLDPKWTDNQLNKMIDLSKLDMIITCRDWYKRINRRRFKNQIVMIDDKGAPHHTDHRFYEPVKTDGHDKDFYLGFTSGTTGLPKGFLRHQQSWIESIKAAQKYFSISENEVVAAPGPMVHSLSLYAAVHTLNVGASFFISESFEPENFIKDIKSFKINTIFIVPTMLEALLSYDNRFQSLKLSKILSSGDKLSAKTVDLLKQIMPEVKLYEYYGASETSFMTIYDHQKHKKPHSVGKPFYQVDISIRNDKGEEAGPGENGVLYVRSPMLFSGYDGIPKLEKDWMTVGDIAYRDNDGFVFLVGRKKNMMITGGLNVYPEEVEACLKAVPHITKVAVIGLPDRYWGEKITAVLLEDEASQISDIELENHCKAHLSSYKCPKAWVRIAEFPLTSSGKIARQRLKERLIRAANRAETG